MFAKPQKTSGNSLLKNKDVKKFRKDLSLCARDAVSDEQLQTLIPNKATIKKQSFQAPSRMVVFVNEDTREPLAFDETGKGDAMCASVYALWRLSALLPRLEVHAPVSEFVLRGADVMLPGVVFTSLEKVQALRKGELRAVFARGNPHAFAVGELLVDAEDIQKHGKKGKGLRVLHYYGDELWKMGPQTAPNPGFPGLASGSEKVVIKAIGAAAEDSDEELEEAADAGVDVSGVSLEVDESEELEEKKEITQTEGDDDDETTPVVTKEEMDVLYYQSLLQVMRSGRLKDKHLPMLASTFHATVLLPCRPAGSSLNIKQSSHKKLSTFLKAMAAKGFLSVSDKDGVQSITTIGPRHPDTAAHTLYRTAEDEKREVDAAGLLGADGRAAPPPPGTYAPEVQEFMGLSQQLKRLLTEDRELAVHFEDVIRQRHWAPVEVRDLINKYVDLAGLVDTRDKKYVRLNGPLTDAVFSGGKAPVGGYPNSMARPDLYAILLSKCTKYHRVVLFPGHEPKILGGPIRKIELLAEQSKKHRSSTVTTMAYYQQFGIDGATFAKEAQKKWGCSAALQASDDKSKGEEVKVQGQMINELCDYLATKYKIPAAKYVNVTYGKNVKPKKK